MVVFANGKIEMNGRLLRGFVFNASRRLSRAILSSFVVVEDLRARSRVRVVRSFTMRRIASIDLKIYTTLLLLLNYSFKLDRLSCLV